MSTFTTLSVKNSPSPFGPTPKKEKRPRRNLEGSPTAPIPMNTIESFPKNSQNLSMCQFHNQHLNNNKNKNPKQTILFKKHHTSVWAIGRGWTRTFVSPIKILQWSAGKNCVKKLFRAPQSHLRMKTRPCYSPINWPQQNKLRYLSHQSTITSTSIKTLAFSYTNPFLPSQVMTEHFPKITLIPLSSHLCQRTTADATLQFRFSKISTKTKIPSWTTL